MMRKNIVFFLFSLAVLMGLATGLALSNTRFENLRAENGEFLWSAAAAVDVLTPGAITLNVAVFTCADQLVTSTNLNVPAGEAGRTFPVFLGPILIDGFPPQPLKWRFLVGTVERGDRSTTITDGRFAGECPAAAVPQRSEPPTNLALSSFGVVNPKNPNNNEITPFTTIVDNARPEEGNYFWYGATIADRLTADAFIVSVQVTDCQGQAVAAGNVPVGAGDVPAIVTLTRLQDGGVFVPLVWRWSAAGDSETAITDADGVSEGECP
jgi:hypothetical protein